MIKQQDIHESIRSYQLPHLYRWNMVLNLLKPHINQGTKIVDVGCGTGEGFFLEVLREKFGVVGEGFNLTSSKIIAEKGFRVHEVDVECDTFPCRDEEIDIVFCGEILEHLRSINLMFEEINRVLAPDGIIDITTPNAASWTNRCKMFIGRTIFYEWFSYTKRGRPHVRLYLISEIIEVFKSFGFIPEIYTVNLWRGNRSLKRRLFNWVSWPIMSFGGMKDTIIAVGRKNLSRKV
ncbi:MAG: class I SAM-dependent methyltransferase [Candidatus Hodarchaeales archaeon]|jgi:ubiquinone/menaquinone biosynthesis C-methylase UbiE